MLTKHGVSTTQARGIEKCERYLDVHGKERMQYDYRLYNGQLFSCIGDDIVDCREKRNAWMKSHGFGAFS